MDSLMLPIDQQEVPVHRKVRKNEYTPVPLRWRAVLSYHLAGKKAVEIKRLTGYALPTIYAILNNPNVSLLRQQLLASTQQEFEALFASVVDTIRGGLASSDEQVKLTASNMWLKAHGKYQNKHDSDDEKLTAEDVVASLLKQQINIQVNVDNSTK